MENKQKRLAVFGGNNITREMQRFAKEHQVSLIGFGNLKTTPVGKIADEYYYVNCCDAEIMIPLLKEKNIDGILSCSSEEVNRRALDYISKTGYPFYSTPHQWDILMKKNNFKEYAQRFGIEGIPQYRIDPTTCEPLEEIPYPVIVKPVDSGASNGISICNDEETLKNAVLLAKKVSFSGAILCEKFLTGPYFQFEVWMQDGKGYLPYSKGRVFYPPVGDYPAQPFADLYPSEHHNLIEEKLFHKLVRMLLDLDVKNGSCMFQGIIENGTPYIMDTAFRLSGGMDYRVVEDNKGVDLVASHMMYSLSGQFGTDFSALRTPLDGCYVTLCIGIKNGVLGKISGVEEIQKQDFVYGFYQYYHEGDTMQKHGLFLQTFCRIFMKGSSKEALHRNIQTVLDTLQVLDVDGNNMILPYPYHKEA